ncbi:hypothetical protein Tco_1284991 [Tanacetum coccineum]
MGTFRETLAEGTEGALHLGPERPRVYSDLSPEDKERYNAGIRATNILLQGLPKDIYSIINHYTGAKDIWDNVKMLLEGSELTKEDRESQLYDDFEHFRQHKGETIHDYYVRFAKLINDMRNIKMTLSRMQLNSKFVNNMLPEWGRFVTAVKLNRVDPLALMSNVAPQQYNSQSSTNPSSTYVPPHFADNSQLDSGLSPTDNLIENLTNTLALLTQSYKTYLPQTNNQLRTSSNPRNQATVQEGRVVVQNVQGRQNRGHGNNARGAGKAGYGGAQNIDGNANPVCKGQRNASVQRHYRLSNDHTMIDIYNDMYEPHAQSISKTTRNTVVDNSLTAELATYKEQVELYERRARFELTEREQKIDEQLRIVITDRNIKEENLKKELHSVKLQLASTINHNKSMVEEVTSLKKDFKQKENKYLEEFLDMKALKEKVEDKIIQKNKTILFNSSHVSVKPKPIMMTE